jgi:hypothetical protein
MHLAMYFRKKISDAQCNLGAIFGHNSAILDLIGERSRAGSTLLQAFVMTTAQSRPQMEITSILVTKDLFHCTCLLQYRYYLFVALYIGLKQYTRAAKVFRIHVRSRLN